ncbi:MAG: DEAD/DEAH box helicase [Verrucomicrobia bacterium]|jgi:ATP-dependent RNA helicase RhlE|nr:DEAD/DEAH box helicase [Verrucomicrobiota bacterium]
MTESETTSSKPGFDQLGLADTLLRAVRDQRYATPTPIQEKAIPPALAGRDVFGCAQTGTGKTAAFVLPILQQLDADGPCNGKRRIRALVLTPTRELAAQISESAATYGAHLPLTHTVIYGGVNQNKQVNAIRRGIDVLVACPGRLLDLMNQGIVDLRGIEYFVLDEADRMLDMGFIHDVRRIIAKLPKQRQTLFFSATVPNAIRELADSLLTDPVTVRVTPAATTAETVDQALYMVGRKRKLDLLRHLLKDHTMQRTLVFTRTKHGADRVAKRLIKDKVPAAAIHGNKSQNARTRALEAFKRGDARVLVASDIAARGIDIDSISHVINYELPHEPETYVHRIGRTGRAGNSGRAISFCDLEEQPRLRSIEKLIRTAIPEIKDHPYAGSHIGEEPRPGRQPRPPRDRTQSSQGQRRRRRR